MSPRRVLLAAAVVGAAVVAAPACAPDRYIPDAPADGGSLAQAGLPCDVAGVLVKDGCLTCHGQPLSGGAPMPLVTRADLAKASASDPAKSFAQVSLERMQNAANPMPPGRLPPAADVAVLQAWVEAGLPEGACDTADGGFGPTYPHTEPGCLTNNYWTGGDDGSSRMNPGLPCLACHLTDAQGERDAYKGIGGTVYGGLHEDDTCNGASAVKVEITGKDGTVITLTTNSAGNFGTNRKVTTPYTARVLVGDKVREMLTPQTDFDCNGCHTQDGANDAPGRIVVP